jgi:hypothetical protein
MALDFPNSPTNGQVFTSGTKKWTWDGSYWNASNITPNATTTTDGSMSSTDKTRLDDASATNGIVKCNGSGDFSAAVAGTDYLTSATLGSSPAAAKAWATYNGVSNSLLKNYGVLSVTRTSTGRYTFTYDSAFSSTNYCAIAAGNDHNIEINSVSTNSLGVELNPGGSPANTSYVNIIVFDS